MDGGILIFGCRHQKQIYKLINQIIIWRSV